MLDQTEPIKYKTWNRLWVFWLILIFIEFILYILSMFIGGRGSIFGYLNGLVGLFIPLGFYSLLFLVTNKFVIKAIISIGVVIIGLCISDPLAKKLKIPENRKWVFNLVLLLLLTLICDLILYAGWESLMLFLQGGPPTTV